MSKYKIYLKTEPVYKQESIIGKRLDKAVINLSSTDETVNVIENPTNLIELERKQSRLGRKSDSRINNFGIIEPNYSLMELFYIVNPDNPEDSFVFDGIMETITNPIEQDALNEGYIELSEFLSNAEVVSKNAIFTDKETNEKEEKTILFKNNNLLLTYSDGFIFIEPITNKIDIEYKEDVSIDLGFDFLFNSICNQLKESGFDISGLADSKKLK